METLTIGASKYTPDIVMDINGVVSFVGKSYPENTFEFYKPVMDWMKVFFSDHISEQVTISFEISYFNSSSSKLFFDFFDLLEDNNDDFNIVINWIYDEENESAEEAGEDFIEDFDGLNINLVKK